MRVASPPVGLPLLLLLLLRGLFAAVTAFAPLQLRTSSFQKQKPPKIVSDSSSILCQRWSDSLRSTVSAEADAVVRDQSTTPTTTLGLLTFDLDDTIYPLSPVIAEANAAFARAMAKYGFADIQGDGDDTIAKRSVQIRTAMAKLDPIRAATLSHTEIRKLAIRTEMEGVMLQRKLEECALDWATNVESLGPAVVTSAKK